jgi:hypothetical protein
MNIRTCLALAACLASPLAFGEACDVTTRPASSQVPVVQPHICYEYRGMPPGSIDWSCSNEDKSTTPTEKRKVESCPTGAVASCSATLTQETLANERSASREPGRNTPQVPDDANLITWYYELQEQAQARIDCEQAGGRFSFPLK